MARNPDSFEREALSSAILEVVREPLLILDDEFRILMANPAFHRAFGLEPAAAEGVSVYSLKWGPWKEPALRAYLEAALRGVAASEGLRWEAARPDGSKLVLLLSARRLDGGDPERPLLLLGCEDARGKEEIARELELVRGNLQLILESMRDFAVVSVNADGETTFWNEGAERMFQWTGKEVYGRTLDLLFTPEDQARGIPARELKAAAEKGRAMDERWHVRKDGSRFYASGVVTPVRDAAGRIVQYTKVARDITERVRYEEALRASKEQADLILNSTLEGIYGIDREGRCIFANANCLKLLGFGEAAEMLGKDMHALLHHTRPDGGPFPKEECALHGECGGKGDGEASAESVFWRRDGRPVPVEYGCRAMRKDGEIVGAVVTFLDISERKELQARLRRAEEHRFETQKMEAIGRLAGGVAHEFNNSLTAINGYAELLLRTTPEDDPRRGGLEEILRAGQKAAGVTQHLLSFGRKQMLRPETFDLNRMIESRAKLLHKTVGDNAHLHLILAPDLGPISVDPRWMEQAIVSLTLNAREALDDGGSITVETRNLDLEEEMAGLHRMIPPGRYVALIHTDTGRGIPKEKLKSLFDPFYSTKPMGSIAIGMGLSSLYGFVRQSGGYLKVESEVGRGSRFSILFPRADGAPTEAAPATPPAGPEV
jgi:PAS domain S-box-containing protein